MSDDLAQCLRAWRRRLRSEDVGLPRRSSRRTSGLRREEVAVLAGVSVHYVQRLEQGSALAPSPSVVSALAKALRLSAAERALLYRLAGLAAPPVLPLTEELPESVRQTLARLADAPALVQDHSWTVVAATPAAIALFGDIVGLNGAQMQFREPPPAGRPPEEVARYDRAVVGELNRQLADRPDDPVLRALVEELRRDSPRFAALWSERPANEPVPVRTTIGHPVVGVVSLACDAMSIRGTDLTLVVWSAEPGSRDAQLLEELIGTVPRGSTRRDDAAVSAQG